ncbi:unnamed protein product [Brassica rapa subsp. trilocularis]
MCVSKRWASVLRRPDFTELFFTKSLARPLLYFACRKDDDKAVLFFSTPLGKHEWFNHIYKLPRRWNDVVGEKIIHFVGVTATNEFVMSPFHSFHPFHVYYYNLTRVEIQGMEAYDRCYGVRILVKHVEDVELM